MRTRNRTRSRTRRGREGGGRGTGRRRRTEEKDEEQNEKARTSKTRFNAFPSTYERHKGFQFHLRRRSLVGVMPFLQFCLSIYQAILN